MARTALSTKLLVCAVSTVVSAGVAWFAYQQLRSEKPSVLEVDTSEEIVRMMNERARVDAAEQVDSAGSGEAVGPGDPDDPDESGGSGDPSDPSKSGESSDDYPPPLVREPLDEETAERFFPANAMKTWLYHPLSYSVRIGGLEQHRNFEEHPKGGWTIRTNSLGMREDEEVLAEHPDLRILVTGDSHTDGVCANSESLTNVLEALLAAENPGRTIEALNAGAGGHNLYNYLGTFERFAYLEPDIFVVVVYGGNDFSSSILMHRYFARSKPFKTGPHAFDPKKRLKGNARSIGSQEMVQEVYFLNNPDDVEPAVDLACSFSVELERMCSEAGAKLLLVYLPPPTRGQPEFFHEELAEVLRTSDLEGEILGVSDRIADQWLRFLEERGFAYVDLRGYFRAMQPLLYWRTDHHINLAGHRLAAEAILERIREMSTD